jgi:hypothetical protein
MSILDFIGNNEVDVEAERRNRIRLAFAAYAYEIENESIISDAEFDALCLKINPEVSTVEEYHCKKTRKRYEKIDRFWASEFSPDTGQWIHKHPELPYLSLCYRHFRALGCWKK